MFEVFTEVALIVATYSFAIAVAFKLIMVALDKQDQRHARIRSTRR